MPTKIRIHELATELGVSNETVLEMSASLGIGVKSPASSIVNAQAFRLRRKAIRDGLVPENHVETVLSEPRYEGTSKSQTVADLSSDLGVSLLYLRKLCADLLIGARAEGDLISAADVQRIQARHREEMLQRERRRSAAREDRASPAASVGAVVVLERSSGAERESQERFNAGIEPLVRRADELLHGGAWEDDKLVEVKVENAIRQLRFEMYEIGADPDPVMLDRLSLRLSRLVAEQSDISLRPLLIGDLLDAAEEIEPQDADFPAIVADRMVDELAADEGTALDEEDIREWVLFQMGWLAHVSAQTADRLTRRSPIFWTEVAGVTGVLSAFGLTGTVEGAILGVFYAILAGHWRSRRS